MQSLPLSSSPTLGWDSSGSFHTVFPGWCISIQDWWWISVPFTNVFASLCLTWHLTVRWGDASTWLVAHCKSHHTFLLQLASTLHSQSIMISLLYGVLFGRNARDVYVQGQVPVEWMTPIQPPPCFTYPPLIPLHWSRVVTVNSLTDLSLQRGNFQIEILWRTIWLQCSLYRWSISF